MIDFDPDDTSAKFPHKAKVHRLKPDRDVDVSFRKALDKLDQGKHVGRYMKSLLRREGLLDRHERITDYGYAAIGKTP